MGLFGKGQASAGGGDPTLEEYRECHEHRRAMLDGFRRNAFKKYSFIYPDAAVLMNRFRHTFMILDRKSGRIMHGLFADRECPFLEYVPADAEPHVRRAAVNAYREQVKGMQGFVRKDSPYNPKHYVSRASATGSDFLRIDGFYVRHTSEVQMLYGASLFLDGRRIATSAYWKPKPLHHFSSEIFDNVVAYRPETSTGWSSLVMILGEFDFGMSGTDYRYEVQFPNTVAFDDPTFDASSKAAILALRDFMCGIESALVEKQVDGEDKDDFVRDEMKASLDSPGDPLQ